MPNYNNIYLNPTIFRFQPAKMKASVLAGILIVQMTLSPLGQASAQKAVYENNKLVGMLKQTHVIPATYIIESVDSRLLITIYPGKTLIKGKQCYLLTFAGDVKRAAVPELKKGIDALVLALTQSGVLIGAGIDSVARENFIKAHPVPQGYPDAELLNEYGKN